MSNRSRPDFYSQKAKKEGYMARSVYKLEEIQTKNRLIKPGDRILDVGASPGSWTQYCLRLLKGKGAVIAADLKPLGQFKINGELHFILGDVFSQDVRGSLYELGPFDVIISDAAPSTTGNRLMDTRRSYNLVEQILDFALIWLKPGGNFTVKVFQGGDETEIFDKMKNEFDLVKKLKPKAVRKESFEYYFIGLGKKNQSAVRATEPRTTRPIDPAPGSPR
jgi:23S rRNA (uridine2552-2'-O)-methyltransferase